MLSQLRAIKVLGWRFSLRANKLKRFSQETIRGFYMTRTIIALLNIGFFDELVEQLTVNLKGFAARKDLDLSVLRILCDYLFALKILNRDGENYSFNSSSKLAIEMLSGAFYVVYAYEDVFYHLEELLRKDKKYGLDVCRRSEFVAKGSGAVGKLLAFPLVTDLLIKNKFKRILDLGCGDATFLIELCRHNDYLMGYGLDISPEGIALGQRKVAQQNLQDRVHLFVGDIFKIDQMTDQLPQTEVATCIYVLHEFLSDSKERTLELLRKFKTSFPGVPLVICEVIRHSPEELRAKQGGILEIQLFHDLSKQKLFSREEWQALFRQAEFTNIKEEYLRFVKTAIYTIS